MKITTKQTVTEEKEIKLPYFFKQTYSSIPATYRAIFTEDKAISIDSSSVTCTGAEAVAQFIGDANAVECSEQEFTEAFEVRMEHFLSFLPQTT